MDQIKKKQDNEVEPSMVGIRISLAIVLPMERWKKVLCQGPVKRMNLDYLDSVAKGSKEGDKRKVLSLEN